MMDMSISFSQMVVTEVVFVIVPIVLVKISKDLISKDMTVAELIEKLKKLPQDYTVTASRHDDYGYSYEVINVYEYDKVIHEVELS